ncbi:RteC domain-containing protein [Zobellia galactanivorans]|uniref:RteC domain-containing protein n=1 Tax=Zobellia galactanivorans (strain DSM 12802 / CCUG 47099 / CIP 106680 / NCIMB 13871 / Dsij) TaxID=63186 RepID=UPI001C073C39|nr:RteC domain-containing protein [Zobellia galactanivorans]MBU3026092.1 RteC domain-containing protein [Zobellia galactanivorans]
MDLKLLGEDLLKELDGIRLENLPILEQSNRSIELSRNLLTVFKRNILVDDFESVDKEIFFFKKIKQVPLVKLIYFSEIHSFEIQFPKVDRNAQLKFIKKKINKLNRFFLYNIDFGQYVNSGATHFDKVYYTRKNLETYRITTSKFYFQDPDFCTPRDMLLGKFKAFIALINYMDIKQERIKNSLNGKKILKNSNEKIDWPFTNTDWVELLYALCAAGMAKQNGLSIIKISKILQEVFDFTPKEIYKTFQDIKSRKNSRTLFLDQLTASLLSEMDKSEE